MAPETLKDLKDAIIELYLAIKIRSTEEVRIQPHNISLAGQYHRGPAWRGEITAWIGFGLCCAWLHPYFYRDHYESQSGRLGEGIPSQGCRL